MDPRLIETIKRLYGIESDEVAQTFARQIQSGGPLHADYMKRSGYDIDGARDPARYIPKPPPPGMAPTNQLQEKALVLQDWHGDYRTPRGGLNGYNSPAVMDETLRRFRGRPYQANVPRVPGPLPDSAFPQAPMGSPELSVFTDPAVRASAFRRLSGQAVTDRELQAARPEPAKRKAKAKKESK